ncbi:probable serine/threonine protein kinase IRE isoform X1 [Setaria italica]|uniref:probable serine/threonine protein kinase IRE isoform X1 n=1 Tax=Setaria italica TaxID=4555 RepID=UPI000BE5BAB1|nr:probable serine/threonine protein kinase IRE isoform X1 [Setaria italica]XP_022680697.1 probable serine/threonine protein kinase IRE isoform X1 [Setaria italica]
MSGPQKDDGVGGARGRPAMVDAGGAREMDSPRFRAILRATSGRRKRAPDVKSFSHELSAGAGVPAMRKMVRGGGLGGGGGTGTAPEEFIGAIRTKFIRLKQEVDSELGVFAGDLVGVLERGDLPEDRRLALEDLLVAAQRCAEMSPEEFWTRCEGIVQGLDDRRQELPAGFPKQDHTRILFILTRCTRLLQFRKEAAAAGCRYAGDDGSCRQHVLGLHQLSDLGLFPSRADGGDLGRNSTSSLTELKERLIRRRMLEHKNLTVDFSPARIFSSGDGAAGAAEQSPSGKMASWKKLPSPAEKNRSAGAGGGDDAAPSADEKKKPVITRPQGKPSVDEIVERVDAASIHPDGLSCLAGGGGAAAVSLEVPSQFPAAQQIIVDGKPRMICRICDFEIPMACAEGHLVVCTLADRCDAKGHTADQRLLRIADVLGRVLACFTGGGGRASTSSSESSNPDHDALSHLLAVPSAELFSEGALSPAPAPTPGSLPHSPLLTPRTSHAESQLARHFHAGVGENFQQIESLLAIARSIECIKSSDYNSLEDLSSFLEDLNAVIDTRKVDALVVETFGRRIAKLLQEKFMQLCGQIDDMNAGEQLHAIDEEGPTENSSVSSRTSQALNGNAAATKFKDRTSIEDFEIIKPISRGAFGRVFLARKRVTGDLFAIKVLKKADMIRKNAVESILAERDILISARNPFVVRFFYSFTCRENLYLVMEYLNGGDLYSLLRNLGCLDEDMARTYIAELVLALEYLHSMNVIHRDLKPDNLLIGRDGHIKLTDFGLSKVGLINSTDDLSGPDVSSVLVGDHQPADAEQRAQQRQQRQRQTAVGTPDYLAPEILLGMAHGPTADWWSVGIILFELLVGIPPFNAEHPQIIFDNIMNREIPWPHVPEELSFEAYDLIDKLLMENPVQRLGATGAGEVKAHPFFKDINWDMLARQKVAFIPSTDDEYDTSYFACRHAWGTADEHVNAPCNEYDDRSDTSSMSCCSSPHSCDYEEDGDECGSMEEFGAPLSVKYSFSNFSFKNISQLASMNYDLITKHNEDPLQSSKS